MRDTVKVQLSPDDYLALARLAERECRPVPMQAQHIVREALRQCEPTKEPTSNREAVCHASR